MMNYERKHRGTDMDVPASAKHLAECNDVADLCYGTWH